MRNLKRLREEKQLNQMDMAEELGMPSSTYQQYEAGVHEPSFKTLIKMADYFQVSTDFLIDRTNIRGPIPTLEEEIANDLACLKNEKVKAAIGALLKEARKNET